MLIGRRRVASQGSRGSVRRFDDASDLHVWTRSQKRQDQEAGERQDQCRHDATGEHRPNCQPRWSERKSVRGPIPFISFVWSGRPELGESQGTRWILLSRRRGGRGRAESQRDHHLDTQPLTELRGHHGSVGLFWLLGWLRRDQSPATTSSKADHLTPRDRDEPFFESRGVGELRKSRACPHEHRMHRVERIAQIGCAGATLAVHRVGVAVDQSRDSRVVAVQSALHDLLVTRSDFPVRHRYTSFKAQVRT